MVSDDVFIAAKQIGFLIRDTAKQDVVKKTGALARGYKVENRKKLISINGAPRAMAVVFNSDPAAAADEFGNSRQQARRTLRKAAGKVGELKGEPG
jgi:hypothetical protein